MSDRKRGSVGRAIPHDDALGHVTGTAPFVGDLPPLAGELQLAVVPAPIACGTLREVDAAPALSIPGVAAVITAADVPGSLAMAPLLADEPVLPERRIDYLGQPVAVVAGETDEIARRAAGQVRIDVEAEEPLLELERAMAAGALLGEPRSLQRGDFAAAYARAPRRHEGTLRCGGQDHFSLEGQACLAWPDENGAVRLLSATQNPTAMQAVVANVLGVPRHAVVCECRRLGGGFGGKETQSAIPASLAALVVQQTGRPARLLYRRSEDLRLTGKRHPFRCDYRVGFDRDGAVLALEIALAADGGAFLDLSAGIVERALFHLDNAYFLPDVALRGAVYRTHHPPNTAVRGFGAPQAVAAIENVLQEVAQLAGRDALDVRRGNLYGAAPRDTTPYGQTVSDAPLHEMFDRLEQSSDYRRRALDVADRNRRDPVSLRGIALTPVKYGISFTATHLNQANALVNVYADGSVQVSTGATEMGQGVHTRMRQVAADAFGVAAERVRVMPTSTEKNNNTSPTAASVSADLNGAATLDACRQIRGRLDAFARRIGEPLDFGQLCERAWRERIDLGARGFYATPEVHFDWTRGRGEPFFYFTSGAAVSEVEIDRFTGELRVLRADVLMDLGRRTNPGIDEGQVIGGLVQGMGWCTREELVYDDRGALLTDGGASYKIPAVGDVPGEIRVAYIERPNPLGLAGSRAVGEPPLLLGLSVWAAAKHALSFADPAAVPQLGLPATGEQILAALLRRDSAAGPARGARRGASAD